MIGRIAYGGVFVLLAPALLAWWAWRMEARLGVGPDAVGASLWGLAVAVVGGVLMVAGMVGLVRRGGGLPMNAYPTSRWVTTGAYALVPHPIYTGFVVLALGVSWWVGSSAGVWVVAPAAGLACVALVYGYERDATRGRLGGIPPERPLLSVPAAGGGPLSGRERAGVWLLVYGLWLALYEWVGHVPVAGAVDLRLPLERGWPVVVWTEWVYASVYLVAAAAPWACSGRRELREWARVAVTGTFLGILVYLSHPGVSPPRAFEGGGLSAWLLAFERADGLGGRAAWPSFHVFWAAHSAWVIAARWPRWSAVAWAWAVGVAVSCTTTGMHALADLPAGLALWALAVAAPRLARRVVAGAERVANSWREWRIGPVRVINHGVFAGCGAALGLVIAGAVAGPASLPWLAATAVVALVAAALWGQLWVQAPTSLRPFGYFGAVLGAVAGLAAMAAAGRVGWTEAAALAVAAPWVQMVGRLRCLVQGCCHGGPAHGWWAIRYHHPCSRVVRASGLGGVPVHPTPVYSMVGNAALGCLLARWWWGGVPPAWVFGAYLAIGGGLRFIEEHYRGEPHTPVVWGLRVYQWFAVVSVAAGVAVMSVWAGSWAEGELGREGWMVWVGWPGLAGLAWMAGMGVDVPGSSRRFARLT